MQQIGNSTPDTSDIEDYLTLRKATPADFDSIREVATLSRLYSFKHFMTADEVKSEVEKYYNDGTLNEILSNPANAIFLAERNNTLLGYLTVLPKDRRGNPRLLQFYVRPEAQRQGVGELLFERGCSFMRQAGIREMFISTVSENMIGRRFYEKNGAELLDEYDSIWDGKTRTVVVYKVTL